MCINEPEPCKIAGGRSYQDHILLAKTGECIVYFVCRGSLLLWFYVTVAAAVDYTVLFRAEEMLSSRLVSHVEYSVASNPVTP